MKLIKPSYKPKPSTSLKKWIGSSTVMSIAIIAAMTQVAGCSTKRYITPTVPVNLKQPCPNLKTIESNSGEAWLRWGVDTVAKYNDCKSRHGAIVKALK